MSFLKGLGISILNFLLFLSLSLFGLALTLNNTILNPDFIVAELDKLDIHSLATEIISEQIPQELEFMTGVIDDTIADLEPWIREQMNDTVYSGYDYLKGRSQSLDLVVSIEPVKEKFKNNLWQAFLESLPPALSVLPPAALEQRFNEFYDDFTSEIPSTFEFDENTLPPEVMTQLQQIRQYIGYFQLGYKALMAFILLLILGIILISRQVRGSTRVIGTTFLTYGAFGYAGILIAKHFATPYMAQIPLPEMPPALQAWMQQLFNNLLVPLEMFSLGILIGGVALLIVSFAYKPRQPSY